MPRVANAITPRAAVLVDKPWEVSLLVCASFAGVSIAFGYVSGTTGWELIYGHAKISLSYT